MTLEQKGCLVCVQCCAYMLAQSSLTCSMRPQGRRKDTGHPGSSVAPVQELEGVLPVELLRRGWFYPESSSVALAHFLSLTFQQEGVWHVTKECILLLFWQELNQSLGQKCFSETSLLNHSFDQRPAQSTFFLLLEQQRV